MSDAPVEQKDLRAYIRPVLKRWWLILAVVPVVTIGTYLYYDAKPKVYQSSTQLYFQPSTLQQLVFGTKLDNQSRVENSALLIETNEVGERASQLLENEGGQGQGAPKGKKKGKAKANGNGNGKDGAPSKGQSAIPAGGISAQAIEKTNFLVITGTSDSPDGAARLANAYAQAFVTLQRGEVRHEARGAAHTAEKQLKEIPKNDETLRRREALEGKIQDLQLLANQPQSGGGIVQVDPALPFPEPIEHDPSKNAIFAFVVGLMLAIGGAYGLEYLNRKITRVEDVEEIYELPVLTEIPQVGSPAPREPGGVTMAKALSGPFQRLQLNLDVLARERPLKTILVASAAPEEGKSIVARNLGLAYREAGRNVAVLDADFRKASQGGLLAVDQGLGLADILAGRASFGQVVREVSVHSANGNGAGDAGGIATPTRFNRGELAMVPAGEHHGNLSLSLSSEEMRQTLRIATETYGTAIIDSPPLLAVADVLPLLAEADAVILVTRLGVSTRDSARRLMREIRRMPGVFVAGVVVNGIPRRVYRARSYGYDDG